MAADAAISPLPFVSSTRLDASDARETINPAPRGSDVLDRGSRLRSGSALSRSADTNSQNDLGNARDKKESAWGGGKKACLLDRFRLDAERAATLLAVLLS